VLEERLSALIGRPSLRDGGAQPEERMFEITMRRQKKHGRPAQVIAGFF